VGLRPTRLLKQGQPLLRHTEDITPQDERTRVYPAFPACIYLYSTDQGGGHSPQLHDLPPGADM
jgi:hypothetical protein